MNSDLPECLDCVELLQAQFTVTAACLIQPHLQTGAVYECQGALTVARWDETFARGARVTYATTRHTHRWHALALWHYATRNGRPSTELSSLPRHLFKQARRWRDRQRSVNASCNVLLTPSQYLCSFFKSSPRHWKSFAKVHRFEIFQFFFTVRMVELLYIVFIWLYNCIEKNCRTLKYASLFSKISLCYRCQIYGSKQFFPSFCVFRFPGDRHTNVCVNDVLKCEIDRWIIGIENIESGDSNVYSLNKQNLVLVISYEFNHLLNS